ncbi:uncharacterized protein LOC115787211 isoform X2 [Archocentrus centrarchus]|nr:uncharacterized protein LOC115787211 isoform X2 [Archocentrus centrarchus]
MWCYQKPGFETLLLTELQRQQQCSQFCDILLKAEGMSIPAHSCILSAFSPHISSALSSTTTPPEGQSRLLEFRALGACTLLHLVRLLYSGEMAGEGEREKQQAISAAAKLGIHGLVEVTKTERKSRDGVGQCAEVGVQTEPPMSETEGRQGRWRREVRDGSTFLWKEVMSDGGKDMWTQTEDLQINTASLAQAATSFETIDMSAFQSIGHTDPLLVPPQIVPVSFSYPANESQTPQLSSTHVASLPEAASTSVDVVAQPCTSVPTSLPHFSSQTTLCAADPQNGWASQDVAVAEEWEDEQFEQFQGNIPGFIRYFLNPEKEEGSRGGRAGRRREAGIGGARRAEMGEKRARRPRGEGRGRGRLTQMVQEVRVSRLQKSFLHRCGTSMPRIGQGGGAVGRKLCLKNRESLKTGRRGRGKAWELSLGGDALQCVEFGGSTPQRGRKTTAQQFDQGSLPASRARRSRAKTATSASFSSPPMHSSNAHALSTSNLSFQASPCPNLLSPAVSYTFPASPFLAPAPPPHEDQPEHIDRLLEEVMMGLDILPNSDRRSPNAQLPLQAGCSSGGAFASSDIISNPNEPQGLISEVAVVVGAAGCASSANGEVLALEQQSEGELSDMLDNLLQSFEQHIESCHATEEREMSGVSSTETSRPYTVLNTSDQTKTPHMAHLQKSARRVRRCQTPELQSNENESPQSCSQSCEAPARRTVSPKHTEEARPTKQPYKKRRKQYLFSLEKKKVKVKNPVSSGDGVSSKGNQLQQIPVVKLERRGLLPVRVTLQRHVCQSLEGKGPAETKAISSTVKKPHVGFLKTYPIRSRYREAQIMDALPFLEEPLSAAQPGCRQRGRPRKNDLLSSSNRAPSTPPTQGQPVDICNTDEPLEKNQERHEEETAVESHEEAEGPLRRGQKRGADSDEDTSDDATVTKTACFETTQPPNSEPADFSSEPTTTNLEEAIDVETVSLTSVGGVLQEEEEEKPLWRELRLAEGSLTDEEMQSSANEIIDVDGEYEDKETQEEDHCQSRTAPTGPQPSVSPSQSARESWVKANDEDIDVIGGSSPIPEPVTISWTESSDGEEEEGDGDVDVVGENKDSASSVIFTAVSKHSVQTEVSFH